MKILEKIIRLCVWDFDSTIMNTLNPEIGKPIWLAAKGTPWPHRGWWGQSDSLDMSVFDFKSIPEVKSAYEIEVVKEDTMNVLLTGRRATSSKKVGLEKEVKAICDANGYVFDRYLLNWGGATLDNKMKQMSRLLKEFPNIREVNLWDDRIAHFDTFNEWGNNLVKSGRLDKFHLTEVFNAEWTK